MSAFNHPSTPEKLWHYSVLSSTNAQAKTLLQEGAAPPFWVISDQQTAGRGRHGRNWVSEPGNFFVTVVKRFSAAPHALTGISLVTAVAVKEAIETATSADLQLTLKWPNDILINNAKVGGILIESQQAPPQAPTNQHPTDLIIGVGVNLTSHPKLAEKEATNLQEMGFALPPTTLRDTLELSLNKWLSVWNSGAGQGAIVRTWQQQAAPLGTPLTVKAGATLHQGKYAGLDAQGSLKLMLENNQIETISAGEVL